MSSNTVKTKFPAYPYTRVLIHGFCTDRQPQILRVWAAPAAGTTLPDGRARSAPHFGRVVPHAGAFQTSKIDDFWSVQQPCIKNPSVSLSCLELKDKPKR